MPRPKNLTKKRTFHGNRYTKISEVICSPDVDVMTMCRPNFENTPDSSRPSTSDSKSSTSKSKVSPALFMYDEEDDFDNSEYSIVDFQKIEALLQSVAVCKVCHNSLEVKKQHLAGLAFQVTIKCVYCDNKSVTNNCEEIVSDAASSNKLYDLNLRLVYGLRTIGKGKAAAEKLCGIMNLSPPVNLFHIHEQYLASKSESVAKKSMVRAAEEAVRANSGCKDLAVAIDGSWQKRGHTSLNGIVSATSLSTGKVLDIEILSKFCKCKSTGTHDESCQANFSGTSGAMEVAGAVSIFKRSQQTNYVRYLEYLGDGDTKAFLEVYQSKPYGPDIHIKKAECIGHIQKRMGTRLRALKSKIKKLPDGTPLGGKNRLTDAAILKLQTFYGLAIRRNTKSVKDMKQGIWAEYFHVLSSNEKPQHALCPTGENTWCKYNLSKLKNTDYDHKAHFHLPENLMTFIKPIFKDLAKPELLEKCLHGKTQNTNESLNSVIWTYVPKKVFVTLRTLKFGVYEAVTTFNDGNIGKVNMFSEMGLKPGSCLVQAMKSLDKRRIREAEKSLLELEKKIRSHQQLLKRRLEDQLEEEEGEEPSYAAGMY